MERGKLSVHCVVRTGLAAAGIIAFATAPAIAKHEAPSAERHLARPMPICEGGGRIDCVVDGDTIWASGAKIRVADIDAPEINRPSCDYEYRLGIRARDRLRDLLHNRTFLLLPPDGRDEDRYGRKLRVIVQDGRSVGDILVSEGLARTWSGRREPWC